MTRLIAPRNAKPYPADRERRDRTRRTWRRVLEASIAWLADVLCGWVVCQWL